VHAILRTDDELSLVYQSVGRLEQLHSGEDEAGLQLGVEWEEPFL
jgi:hypothetical protein